jgi:inner membrane protein
VQIHSHFFWSWLLPWSALAERRDRVIVALAGIAPDVDGLTLLAGREAFIEYHHKYTHHFAGAALVAAAALIWGRRRLATAGFAVAAWGLHLFLDMAGAGERHEDGTFAYPLPLLWPFSDRPFDPFPWSWPLASWQNLVAMGLALALILRMAVVRGRTPIEVFSARADGAVVTALRRRIGRESGPGAPPPP